MKGGGLGICGAEKLQYWDGSVAGRVYKEEH